MFRSVLLDKESWIEHIMLDPVTGLDPPDYKLRAVHGKSCVHQQSGALLKLNPTYTRRRSCRLFRYWILGVGEDH